MLSVAFSPDGTTVATSPLTDTHKVVGQGQGGATSTSPPLHARDALGTRTRAGAPRHSKCKHQPGVSNLHPTDSLPDTATRTVPPHHSARTRCGASSFVLAKPC